MTTATQPQFASNQTEAAAAIGVSEDEWNALKEQPGFPGRSKQGWDIAELNRWLYETGDDTPPADGPVTEGDGGSASDGDGELPLEVPPRPLAEHGTPRRLRDLDPDPGVALPPRPAAPADDEPVEVRSITITLPLAAPRAGTYIADSRGRINTRLRADQLAAFRQLHAGLRESNAERSDGRPVDSAGDVLQYLFGQIQRQLAEAS